MHEADLLRDEPHEWGIADDWQLVMWLLAVPAFYYQLRLSLGAANTVEQAKYSNLRTAMSSYVAYGKQLLAFPDVPPERRLQAMQETLDTLKTIVATLRLDPSATKHQNA
jgi:hypothetical protein